MTVKGYKLLALLLMALTTSYMKRYVELLC